MEYCHFMILLGIFILYILLNIYPFIVYLIRIVKKRDFKELFNVPLTIMTLLIPIIGSIYGLSIVDFENKYYQIVLYTGMYLVLLGIIIDLVVTFVM
jgi:hypothetical protein